MHVVNRRHRRVSGRCHHCMWLSEFLLITQAPPLPILVQVQPCRNIQFKTRVSISVAVVMPLPSLPELLPLYSFAPSRGQVISQQMLSGDVVAVAGSLRLGAYGYVSELVKRGRG
ncbi:hypothetical protein PIB30_065143 [Stylosanthes scabra]|uniref:Uncharacterized protein n=1 Tax=Stylosanthes scabra TaxID=79078 RepID=A0ABU6WLP4_9FABA|nr:hypothetical protein [Stylosanthes scabra]